MTCLEWPSILKREKNKEEELVPYCCAVKGAFPKNQWRNVPVLQDMGRSLSGARCQFFELLTYCKYFGGSHRSSENKGLGRAEVLHWWPGWQRKEAARSYLGLNMKQRVAKTSGCPSVNWSLLELAADCSGRTNSSLGKSHYVLHSRVLFRV